MTPSSVQCCGEAADGRRDPTTRAWIEIKELAELLSHKDVRTAGKSFRFDLSRDGPLADLKSLIGRTDR